MKKHICLLFVVIVCLVCLAACSEEVRNSRTVVNDATDSTITITYEGESLTLNTKETVITNGAVMQGDSVIVEFVGKGKDAKALSITFLPQQGKIIDLNELKNDTTSNLITIPITSN